MTRITITIVFLLLLTAVLACLEHNRRQVQRAREVLRGIDADLRPIYDPWPIACSAVSIRSADGMDIGGVWFDEAGLLSQIILGYSRNAPVARRDGRPLWEQSAKAYVSRFWEIAPQRLRVPWGPDRDGDEQSFFVRVIVRSDDGRVFRVVFQNDWLFRVERM
jgi:hypothetical protein